MTIAWVTGGGTGIGKALAALLYRKGYSVVISGRRKEVLEEAVRDISGQPGSGRIRIMAGDASDNRHVHDLVDTIRREWGDIDLLINNAGVNFHHPFRESSIEEIVRTVDINALAPLGCIAAVLPAMLAKKTGAIVNISSILGKWASPTSFAYSMSKFAMTGLSDALHQELKGTGIHVMTVFPGYIHTAMTDPYATPLKQRLGISPESMARAILKGLRRRRRELYYPFYVPWVLRLHNWFPAPLESLARALKK